MTAASTPLTSLRVLRAEFKSGMSALGHHWELFDLEDQSVGRTKRVYDGVGGKLGKRLAVATGLSTAGSVEIEILDGAGTHVATYTGKGGERRIGRLADPDGQAIGSAEHEQGVEIVFKDASGRAVGRILTPPDDKDAKEDRAGVAFPILDAAGQEVGRMGRTRQAMAKLPSYTQELIWDYDISQVTYENELTRYRGFRSSSNYIVQLNDDARLPEPFATLAILSPVIAGYIY